MSKIIVDCDKMNSLLIPLAANQLNQLKSVVSSAQKVNFPEDLFNWKEIINDVNDSIEEVKNYSDWIKNSLEEYSTNVNNFVDEINEISITEIKIKDGLL